LYDGYWKTIAENLALVTSIIEETKTSSEILKILLKKLGTSELCTEILLKRLCCKRITGKEGSFFRGTAVVFDGENNLSKELKIKK
jgi:dihydroxy-acid dehydratase